MADVPTASASDAPAESPGHAAAPAEPADAPMVSAFDAPAGSSGHAEVHMERSDVSPAPATPRPGGQGISKEKKFSRCAVLEDLCPPGAKITLNYNDHRWAGSFQNQFATDKWIGNLKNRTVTKTFQAASPANWQSALKEIHSILWTKWFLAEPEFSELSLPVEKRQEAGQISDAILAELQVVIDKLPDKKSYQKRS